MSEGLKDLEKAYTTKPRGGSGSDLSLRDDWKGLDRGTLVRLPSEPPIIFYEKI